jgi:hypothetical protein
VQVAIHRLLKHGQGCQTLLNLLHIAQSAWQMWLLQAEAAWLAPSDKL